MGSKLLAAQPVLVHVACEKDLVYTPEWLAQSIVSSLPLNGRVLDPCRGGGAFYNCIPSSCRRSYCEIEEGLDFFCFTESVDWVIGNPPYSNLLGWFRHSFRLSKNVAFLIPLHRVMASDKFLRDVSLYGGLKQVLLLGTGSSVGFPFGHALAVVHYERDYSGGTIWDRIV